MIKKQGDVSSEKRAVGSCFVVTVFVSIALLCAVMIAYLQSITSFTTDDYFYATFWNTGLEGFIQENIAHYNETNGRVVVHILAQTLLSKGFLFFGVFCTVMLFSLFSSCFLWQRRGKKSGLAFAAAGAAFGLMAILTPYAILKQSLLCVADACNYIYPVFMIGITLLSLEKAGANRAFYGVGFLLAFLSGASTEQGGIMAVVILALLFLHSALVLKKARKVYLFAIPVVLLGYSTIFLSPSTQSRFAHEFSLQDVWTGLRQYACNFASPSRSLGLLIFFCLLVSAFAMVKRFSKILYFGLGVALLGCLGYVYQNAVLHTAIFIAFSVFILVVCVVLLFFSDYYKSGMLLFAGLCSALVMIFTSSGLGRVTLPFVLCIWAVSAYFVAELVCSLLEGRRSRWLAGPAAAIYVLVFSLAVLNVIPVMKGTLRNYHIRMVNDRLAQQARYSGELIYKDYDPHFCQSEMFTSDVFKVNYFHYFELDSSTKVQLTYELQPPVVINGGSAKGVTVLKNGKAYSRLTTILNAYRGKVEWMAGDYMVIHLKGREYTYNSPNIYWEENGRGREASIIDDVLVYNSGTYFSHEVLKSLWGIDIVRTSAGYALSTS